jgi:hypothetical protein
MWDHSLKVKGSSLTTIESRFYCRLGTEAWLLSGRSRPPSAFQLISSGWRSVVRTVAIRFASRCMRSSFVIDENKDGEVVSMSRPSLGAATRFFHQDPFALLKPIHTIVSAANYLPRMKRFMGRTPIIYPVGDPAMQSPKHGIHKG